MKQKTIYIDASYLNILHCSNNEKTGGMKIKSTRQTQVLKGKNR